MIKIKKTIFALSALFLSLNASALIPTTHKLRLDTGWEYLKGDLGNVWEAVRPSGDGKPESVPLWSVVKLPHCFNAEDAVDPDQNYYQGPGWYRTALDIHNPYPNGRSFLEFEGAGQVTKVYVYTTLVATHVGGYDQWKVDITDAANEFAKTETCKKQFKGRIPISVRCDNSRNTQIIPSDMSDFNLYGGIYRHLNLVYVPEVSMDRVQIDAKPQGTKKGTVRIQVFTQVPEGKSGSVDIKIFDPSHHLVYSATQRTVTSQSPILDLGNVGIKNMQQWSTDNPQLYTCEVKLEGTGEAMETKERFGFRNFEFVKKGPFKLNGERLLLRGTHRHEDHAGVGNALTEEMVRTEMQQIKDIGCNFIRLGHYQQSDQVLQLCDSLGILVWEEIPWCRGGLGNADYQKQAKDMLRAMVAQHYNHPSIILWGLGNENDWPGDFPTFSKDSIRMMMTTLNDIAHEMDPVRKTCIRRCDFASDIVDVYSPTIWAGWYKASYTDYESLEREGFNMVDHFIHAEWGGDSHAGRHSERNFDGLKTGDKNGDWSESYIVKLFDWHLKEQEKMPWLTGAAFWTFKDFSTPLRPTNPIPYVNQKGVTERDGTPKESYYVFQSYWTTKPMIHIYGHSWPVRWGKENENREVLVYSNCKSVELFVNGISQGTHRRNSQDFPAAGLHWQCTFKDGPNEIVAVSKQNGMTLSDTISFSYQSKPWGKPKKIALTRTKTDDGHPMIEAVLLDKDGLVCLEASDFIEFGCTEANGLLINQGTTRGSRVIQLANGRAHILLHEKDKDMVVSAKLRNNSSIPTSFIQINQ